jgi:short-subunit dehydrogenase
LFNIIITGTSSGLGNELVNRLDQVNVVALTRNELNLSDIDAVQKFDMLPVDMLINCAGTDVDGKIDFVNHSTASVVDIMNINLLSPVILAQKALQVNPKCKIVNITSTNNNRYWPNDLVYSLSKKSLAEFGAMLQIEYPDVNYLEIRLGLTRTNFNQNRYKNSPDRYVELYVNPHLTVEQVADRVVPILFDNTVKFIEVSP